MEDLHKSWPHRWISPKTEVKESQIHGRGTFATEPISKGDIVAVYGGIIVPKSDIKTYREKIGGIRGIQIHENFFICPTESEGGCFNHSCEPNLGYTNTILIVALKNVSQGEELVFDYGMSESNFEPYTCSCKTSSCRKTIKPADWKNPELQKKYGEFFATYLKSKF